MGELTLEVRTDLQAGRVSEGSAAAPCLAEGPAVRHGPRCSVPPFVGLCGHCGLGQEAAGGWEVRSDLEPSSPMHPVSWPTGDLR